MKILDQVKYHYNSVARFNYMIFGIMREIGGYAVFALIIFVVYGEFLDNLLYILEVTLFLLTTTFFMANLSFQFSVENINYNRSEGNNMLFISTNANIKSLLIPITISILLAFFSILFLEPSFGLNNIASWLSYASIGLLMVLTGLLGYMKYHANLDYVKGFSKDTD